MMKLPTGFHERLINNYWNDIIRLGKDPVESLEGICACIFDASECNVYNVGAVFVCDIFISTSLMYLFPMHVSSGSAPFSSASLVPLK